jgi:hypothetical protein
MAAKKKPKNYLKIAEIGLVILAALAAIVKVFGIKKKKK